MVPSVEVMCLEAILHVSNCMDTPSLFSFTPPVKASPLFLFPLFLLPSLFLLSITAGFSDHLAFNLFLVMT